MAGQDEHGPVDLRARARARLLRMHYEAGVGHIGGNLSALDCLVHLHAREMTDDDVFVLSKGHAAGALYVALWAAGQLSDADLAGFHADGTRLAAHPVAGWHPRIPFSTGSLGHGLGLAAGVALAKRLRGEPGRALCLVGDGECQEGSTWEALLFARHQALANLVVLVDANGLQGFGSTADVASLDRIADAVRGIGLGVQEIDGHAPDALAAALARPGNGPRVIVLHTVKGHGVSFMENRMEWHYLPLTAELYCRAIAEVEVSSAGAAA